MKNYFLKDETDKKKQLKTNKTVENWWKQLVKVIKTAENVNPVENS